MVAPPLSQTNYTGIPLKIYHFNRQKLGSSNETGYPGCTDNPTWLTGQKKKDWSGAGFSVTFYSRPAGLPDKKLAAHSPNQRINLFTSYRRPESDNGQHQRCGPRAHIPKWDQVSNPQFLLCSHTMATQTTNSNVRLPAITNAIGESGPDPDAGWTGHLV